MYPQVRVRRRCLSPLPPATPAPRSTLCTPSRPLTAAPQVPRTLHMGVKGTFMDQSLHDRYFKSIAVNRDPSVTWPAGEAVVPVPWQQGALMRLPRMEVAAGVVQRVRLFTAVAAPVACERVASDAAAALAQAYDDRIRRLISSASSVQSAEVRASHRRRCCSMLPAPRLPPSCRPHALLLGGLACAGAA